MVYSGNWNGVVVVTDVVTDVGGASVVAGAVVPVAARLVTGAGVVETASVVVVPSPSSPEQLATTTIIANPSSALRITYQSYRSLEIA